MRGIISETWKSIQYLYCLQEITKYIHTVDKWTRVLIKQLLEFHRVMWRDRYDIIAKANVHSYEGRQQSEMWALCLYLQPNPTELLHKDLYFLQRDKNFQLHHLVQFSC